MQVTIEEAKQKWCPMAKLGDVAANRWSTENDLLGIAGCCCVATNCMLFKFYGTEISTDESVTIHDLYTCGLSR